MLQDKAIFVYYFEIERTNLINFILHSRILYHLAEKGKKERVRETGLGKVRSLTKCS